MIVQPLIKATAKSSGRARPSALAGTADLGRAVSVVFAFAKMGLFARGWDEAPVIRKRTCEINGRKRA